jgi:hypothetical protein
MPENKKLELLFKKISNTKAGVFIDDSNLYYAQKNVNWRVDWQKLKKYLNNYCNILIYNYYLVVPKKSDANYKPTISYLKTCKSYYQTFKIY